MKITFVQSDDEYKESQCVIRADLSLNYRRVQSRLRSGWALEDAVELSKCKTGPCKSGHGHLEVQARR